jgi:hypothetical protein
MRVPNDPGVSRPEGTRIYTSRGPIELTSGVNYYKMLPPKWDSLFDWEAGSKDQSAEGWVTRRDSSLPERPVVLHSMGKRALARPPAKRSHAFQHHC